MNSSAVPNPCDSIDRRHLPNRETFRERDRAGVHVAASDLVDDVDDAHRLVEAILAGLERAGLPRPRQRRAERPLVGHDSRINQSAADFGSAGALGDVDELLRLRKALVRHLHAVHGIEAEDRRATSNGNDHDDERDEEFFHDWLSR